MANDYTVCSTLLLSSYPSTVPLLKLLETLPELPFLNHSYTCFEKARPDSYRP
jgi:hypothetical protein